MGLSFSEAMKEVAVGRCARRNGWDRGYYLRIDSPDVVIVELVEINSEDPYILQMYKCEDEDVMASCYIGKPRPIQVLRSSFPVPFNLSQYSMLMDDWEVFEFSTEEDSQEDGGDNDGEVQ